MSRTTFARLAATFLMLGGGALGSGCASDSAEPQTDGQSTAARPESQQLGMLKYRRQTVHLMAGGRYTVKDADGKILAADLDDWEMAERFPFLYERVREGIANGTLHAGGPGEGFSTGIDNHPTTTYEQGRSIEGQYERDDAYRKGKDRAD